MRYAHESVVHCHAKIVHWQAIAPQDHKVPQRICVEPHIASYSVRYEDILVSWHPEPVAVRCPLQHRKSSFMRPRRAHTGGRCVGLEQSLLSKLKLKCCAHLCKLLLDLLLAGRGPLAAVDGRQALCLSLGLHLLQLLVCAEAGVGLALLHQRIHILLVQLCALRLPVGPMLSPNVRT